MAWAEINDGRVLAAIYEANITRSSRISETTLDGFDATQQFLMDIAMWYGFLDKRPDQAGKRWKLGTIARIFTILLKGGLMIRRSDRRITPWIPWFDKGGPVASVISHTARVMVQLPSGQKETEFWRWLWNGATPQSRGAATHGVETATSELLLPGVRKSSKENKEGSTCNHYGINLALGGEGNTNPVSGNRIYPDGEHGHLYLGLSKNTINRRKVLLIATEQSAPIDRYSGKGTGGVKASIFSSFARFLDSGFGVPDQYGGKHGLGGHNNRAANGGQDWTAKYLKTGQTNHLADYGPGPAADCYIDGMFVDLTDIRFDAIKTFDFTKEMLGLTPEAPV